MTGAIALHFTVFYFKAVVVRHFRSCWDVDPCKKTNVVFTAGFDDFRVHAVVGERVQAFQNQNFRGDNLFSRVKNASHVVVDRLLDRFAFLQGFDLFVHQVKVLLFQVERGQARFLTALTVVQVVVIQAQDGGGVRDQSVGIRVAPLRRGSLTAEQRSHSSHERGFTCLII